MLRGWTTPGWALAGGLLAVMEFGPLNQWMNSYWGGALPAAAGCLVFGALPRLRRDARLHGALRDAMLLGAGLAIHLLTRPYESIFLLLSVALFCPARRGEPLMKPLLAAALVTLPAIGITLLQNKQVTGSWITLPYALSQYQYGVPAALTFQANAVPHRELTREQELDYKMQLSFRGERAETLEELSAAPGIPHPLLSLLLHAAAIPGAAAVFHRPAGCAVHPGVSMPAVLRPGNQLLSGVPVSLHGRSHLSVCVCSLLPASNN